MVPVSVNVPAPVTYPSTTVVQQVPVPVAVEYGRVVNVSSRAGHVAVPFAAAYSTSKGALTRVTEIAAAEARPHGVQLFALEPGTVRTAMTETLLDSEAGRLERRRDGCWVDACVTVR